MEKGRGTHFDADLLDLFKKTAPEIHDRLANRGNRDLKLILDDIARKYFMDDMATIPALEAGS